MIKISILYVYYNNTMKNGAGLIIVSPDLSKVLLVKGPTGKWSFPKGHRTRRDRRNTTNIDLHTAMRETCEETGLDSTAYKICSHEFKLSGTPRFYKFFYAQVRSSDVTLRKPNREIIDLGWFSLDIIKTLDTNLYLRAWISSHELHRGISYILYTTLSPVVEDRPIIDLPPTESGGMSS